MRKLFIEDARIDSFMHDLHSRIHASLAEFGATAKELCLVGIGESGSQIVSGFMANELSMRALAAAYEVFSFSIDSDEDGELFALQAGAKESLDAVFAGQSEHTAYLIFDGVTRSGRTMSSAYSAISRRFSRVWTYSVAVSIGSGFIPTWYGCLYEESEHVILSRQGVTPNAALYSIPKTTSSPAIVLRLPRADDPEFTISHPPSMSRYQAEDRFFDSSTNSKQIFVIEWDSKPIGYVAFHAEDSVFWIDYILICDVAGAGKRGAGIALINHVEAYAKMGRCQSVCLWAIQKKVDWYEKRGFKHNGGRSIFIGPKDSAEEYVPMTHALTNETGHYIF